jgi:hypothetical protein
VIPVGSVEDWYWVNLTGDTHPMHTHLFMHGVVGRVPLDVEAYTEAAIAAGSIFQAVLRRPRITSTTATSSSTRTTR